MLSIKNLSLTDRQTGVPLVADLSFSLRRGDRIAIIGSEGSGKTTLMNTIVFGPPDHIDMKGEIIRQCLIGHMPQTIGDEDLKLTLAAYLTKDCKSALVAMQFLTKIGFDTQRTLNRTLSAFSGGERVKIALARAIRDHPDVLCLDEPTNDLDFETINFLETFLKEYEQPVLLISHDQRYLQNIATGIIHLRQIHQQTVAVSTMSRIPYDAYKLSVQIKDDKDRTVGRKERATYKNKMERHRQIFQKVEYRQNQAVRDPSTARLLKKRMHVLKSQARRYEKDKETWRTLPENDEPINVFFDQMNHYCPRSFVIDFEIEKFELLDQSIINNIRLQIKGTEKIVVTGRNGIGKTTLLKAIKANLEQKGIRVGYIPQRYTEVFLSFETAVMYLGRQTNEEAYRLRQMLGALGFRSEDMDRQAESLSEGQKMKVILLGIVLMPCDLLILDEPTRNMSPLNLDEIYRLFKSFKGPILAVSHDRTMIESVFDEVLVLTSKGLRPALNNK